MLNKVLLNYLKQDENKNIFADEDGSYKVSFFKKKIYSYIKIINEFKKKNKLEKNSNIGIGILLDRNLDYFCIIFATWLTNNYFLPLSRESKKKNINYQLKLSNVAILFEKKGKVISYKKNIFYKKKSSILKKNKKIAYIMFTSGSTGNKKGVVISRSNVENYYNSIEGITKNVSFKSILITTELIFDICIGDIIFALIKKSKIILTSSASNLISLFNLMNLHRPEEIYAVPTTWKKIIKYSSKFDRSSFRNVKLITSGGEALTKNVVKNLFKLFPNAKILNVYGPTEFTVNVTYFNIDRKKFANYDIMPLGKKLKNVSVAIRKEKGNHGELLLAGDQKMLGYLDGIKSPDVHYNGKIYYATGDIVYLDKKNNINFIGRKSDYIKVSGYRINLSSLETTIKKHLNLEICLISKFDKIHMFIFQNKNNLLIKKLNKIFEKNLEKFEIPSSVIFQKNMPVNANGKLDKNKLSRKIKK
tara:strand:+ start:2160 stop:3584 length:1425 start_codon:yes stop_codon:yes gene_type:complete